MAKDMFPKPSVGRMVHFNADGQCYSATITRVYSATGAVCLTVEPPMAHSFYVDEAIEGTVVDTWHWPEQV